MTKEQLGSLIIASEDSLYHVAKTLLREDADCADAIQEAIVSAFTKLHTLRSDEFAKTWLTRILINECYDILRKQKHEVSIEEENMPDLEAAEPNAGQNYSELYEALETLPDEMRICITLFYMEGYSIREIASILEVNENTVKSRLSRAKARLRRALEPEDCPDRGSRQNG
ncbi:MAG: sigma-70 family RNA polymerase sigma factor [Lachnospiraceae bacterium]|nr:sigma-70 family RNA polymerase sigma factor [Lachnospiraceae bacterium]